MISLSVLTSIDFVGQRKAEKLFQILITLFAAIGFVAGFVLQQFSVTLMVLGAGITLASLLVLPPWPFWNRNPLKWQKPVESSQ